MTAPHSTLNFRAQKGINRAVQCLRSCGVITFPTDTLYGVGADVFNEVALQRVFTIKGRPGGLALPVLVDGWERVVMVAAKASQVAEGLARQFWPGPLTLVLPKSPDVSVLVTGGRDTVAVRQPNHWVPQALVAGLGYPITGTSANRSGQRDLLTVDEIRNDLGDLVDYIIDSGPAPQGTPSTVIDVTDGEPKLLREGAIPFAEVLRAIGLEDGFSG
jgi:L-threonylcarbamoyladenylate synthase